MRERENHRATSGKRASAGGSSSPPSSSSSSPSSLAGLAPFAAASFSTFYAFLSAEDTDDMLFEESARQTRGRRGKGNGGEDDGRDGRSEGHQTDRNKVDGSLDRSLSRSPYLRPQLLVLGLQSHQARRELPGRRRGHCRRRARVQREEKTREREGAATATRPSPCLRGAIRKKIVEGRERRKQNRTTPQLLLRA